MEVIPPTDMVHETVVSITLTCITNNKCAYRWKQGIGALEYIRLAAGYDLRWIVYNFIRMCKHAQTKLCNFTSYQKESLANAVILSEQFS